MNGIDTGERRDITQRKVMAECRECGEEATKRISFLLSGARGNPRSSAYGRDDCSFCSDHEEFACDEHERTVERSAPDGYEYCATFTKGDRFRHRFESWEKDERHESDPVDERITIARSENRLRIRYERKDGSSKGGYRGATFDTAEQLSRFIELIRKDTDWKLDLVLGLLGKNKA